MGEIAITAVISIAGTLAAIFFGFAIYKRNLKSDASAEARNEAVVLTEIGYIKSGVDDIKRKQELEEKRYIEVSERLCKVEESAKQAHKRIDEWHCR